jgi:glycosyltransferase involved in cell wall biosynthesis
MPANRVYYNLKPYLPWSFRMALRRIMARRKRKTCQDVWPINEAVGQPPVNWRGWPDGKKFALVLTHDVEGPAGLAKCRQLMQMEKKLGFHSSFNFIPEGDYAVSRQLREELAQNGFEVGVHDLHHDGRLYQSRQNFSENARQINRYLKEWGAVGFRSGFMLHNLEWLHDLDIQYDASTFDTDPFEPQNDGAGTIFPLWIPYPADNHLRKPVPDRQRGYVELPYTLPQDSTLFLLFREPTPEIWLRKLDWVASRGGMAHVNVHPDYLAFEKEGRSSRHFPVAFYEALLERVKAKYGDSCWHALPKEIAEWYGNQHRARIVPAAKNGSTSSASVKPAKKTSWPELKGKRAAVILYSEFPSDPRPWRATEALAAHGMKVDVICLRESSSQAERETVNGVNVLRLPFRRKRESKLNYLWLYSTFLAGCAAILTLRTLRKRYHLIHVHNMPDVLVFSGVAAKLSGAKIILDLHDPMPELMMSIYGLSGESFFVRCLRRLERWSIGFADLALTPNIAFRDLFISRKCPPEKIQIVMNTPQDDIFNPGRFEAANQPNGSSKQFRLMYHGFLVERHGLDMAVDAVARLHPAIPSITFNLYGSRTPYVGRIETQIEQLGLQNQIAYHGRKSLDEIAAAITAMDLGVIPNRRTPFTEINFPTRIFEYLALGKPVIVPRTRGIQDYFDETQMLFFNPDDVADLSRVIQWVWEHPQETAEIVRRGREVYLNHLWATEKFRFLTLAEGLLTDRVGVAR